MSYSLATTARASAAQGRRCAPRAVVCRAEAKDVTGITFQPFEAVQSELSIVSSNSVADSFARLDFHPDCEAAINEQINIEYNVSYVYHALYAYFDRDNVGLPGFAAFFKAASVEEREHAELLMEYQNKRGGKVKLQALAVPEMEFANEEKGDALFAMELALSLEKLNFQKLRHLHAVGNSHEDAAMTDFIEGALLQDQVNSVKEHAVFVSQLRRIGKGHAVYHFDLELAEKA